MNSQFLPGHGGAKIVQISSQNERIISFFIAKCHCNSAHQLPSRLIWLFTYIDCLICPSRLGKSIPNFYPAIGAQKTCKSVPKIEWNKHESVIHPHAQLRQLLNQFVQCRSRQAFNEIATQLGMSRRSSRKASQTRMSRALRWLVIFDYLSFVD